MCGNVRRYVHVAAGWGGMRFCHTLSNSSYSFCSKIQPGAEGRISLLCINIWATGG